MTSIAMSSGAKYYLALSRCPEGFITRIEDVAHTCEAYIG